MVASLLPAKWSMTVIKTENTRNEFGIWQDSLRDRVKTAFKELTHIHSTVSHTHTKKDFYLCGLVLGLFFSTYVWRHQIDISSTCFWTALRFPKYLLKIRIFSGRNFQKIFTKSCFFWRPKTMIFHGHGFELAL